MDKNLRQVPNKKEWIENKMYSDILYCYLQVMSEWDNKVDHMRIVPKKVINFSAMSKTLGVSRQTLAKKYNWLVDNGLIIKNSNGSVSLVVLEKDLATLVPFKTLRIMTNTLNDRTISVFVYLFNRYYAAKKEFIFTYEQIKNFIGLSATTRSNDYIIKDILFILEELGLIETRKENIEDEFGGIKTVYYIKRVNNEIRNMGGIEIKF